MKNYANLNIQKMTPYLPPIEGREKPELLRLDFNERTIPPSKKILEALQMFFSDKNANSISVYPAYADLTTQIAQYSAVKPEEVMITNGSDQGIDLIFRTFTEKNDKVIIPSPSFPMFYQAAETVGSNIVTPSYKKDLSYPIDEVIEEIDETTKLVVICNPNNPTGTLVSLVDVEKIASAALKVGAILYVDEAYYEFSKLSATNLINEYPNLIITRTFSKAFAIPSLRIGYTITNQQNIDEMLKVRGPYDVNMAAVTAARAALDDKDDLDRYVNEVMNIAKPMVEKFFRDNGIEFYPSSANFILFRPKDKEKTYKTLRENGILTRPRKGPNIDGTIRVAIGTNSQMEKFINIYQTLI